MTEQEWLTCGDPGPALEFLRGKASVRKFRLFAVACCRQIEPLVLKTALGYRAVIAAERMADGRTVDEDLEGFVGRLAREGSSWVWDGSGQTREKDIIASAAQAAAYALDEEGVLLGSVPLPYGRAQCVRAADYAARAAAHRQRINDRDPFLRRTWLRERVRQMQLVREVFGSPFQSALAVDPSWLAWNGDTAAKLAAALYEERAFDRLPVLADALEDSGCADANLLGHLRGPGPHLRGCWALDRVLGKE